MNKIILFVIIIFGHISVNGQIISGNVSDEDENPLPYVNIGIVGLNKGTISSKSGQYHIDISGVGNNEIIRFSSVGFKSIEFNIEKLKLLSTNSLNIILKKRTYSLNEVIVRPNNEEPIFIGTKRPGKMAWIWSEAINGAEIGTLFRNDKSILLDKFYFHVNRNYCDSILYRIKIYNGSEEYPNEIINTTDIRFISRISKGWESVALTDYNIIIDKDFIVTLETLESWTSSEYKTTHLSVGKAKGGLSYSRPSSMAPWKEFGNQMSFKIEITEITHKSTNR